MLVLAHQPQRYRRCSQTTPEPGHSSEVLSITVLFKGTGDAVPVSLPLPAPSPSSAVDFASRSARTQCSGIVVRRKEQFQHRLAQSQQSASLSTAARLLDCCCRDQTLSAEHVVGRHERLAAKKHGTSGRLMKGTLDHASSCLHSTFPLGPHVETASTCRMSSMAVRLISRLTPLIS